MTRTQSFFSAFLIPFLIPFLAVAFFISTSANAQTDYTVAKQAYMIDYDTGTVLLSKNANEHMPTSSMSKAMSMYLVFEALRDGRLSLDTKLKVSEKAWRKGGSKMFVNVGDMVKVNDLIQGVLVQSGNDAVIVLAEGLAGTEDAFAAALNEKAKELGMNDSHFMNASGWPDPGHYSTAHDLAILAHHLISDFPEDYHYFSEKEFTYNNIKQGNRNPLLYRDIGADGLKTGHTEIGGYGLMASGKRDGRRVVLVLNGMADKRTRAQEGARLLEWGLRGFKNYDLFKAGEEVTDAKVAMGQADTVPLVLHKDMKVTVPLNMKNDLKVEAVYDGPLVAPIKKGDKVGTLKVTIPRSDQVMEEPLYAGADVAQKGAVGMFFAKAKFLLSGKGKSE